MEGGDMRWGNKEDWIRGGEACGVRIEEGV